MSDQPRKRNSFKKGVVTNPNGGPKLPQDLKISRTLTQIDFLRLTNGLMDATEADLIKIIKDPNATMLKKCVATLLAKATKEGDPKRLEFLLNRTIGKVPERVHQIVARQDVERYSHTPDRELVVQAKQVIYEVEHEIIKDEEE